MDKEEAITLLLFAICIFISGFVLATVIIRLLSA